MELYKSWVKKAYDDKGQIIQSHWDIFIPMEQKVYEDILKNKTSTISGTVKELSARFHMEIDNVVGFIDGINEALENSIDLETITEETYVDLSINFEKLYTKMVEYKAEHLYNLPIWYNIFTEEERKNLYIAQKKSGTVVRGEVKIGRNDPCTCGSGKKYKKCCGKDN